MTDRFQFSRIQISSDDADVAFCYFSPPGVSSTTAAGGPPNTDLGFLVRNLTEIARTVASNTWVSTNINSLNASITTSTVTVSTLQGQVTSIRSTLQQQLEPLIANVSRLSQQVSLVTPAGREHLQNLNNLITNLQQSSAQKQQAIRELSEQIVPEIRQNIAQLQSGVSSLPNLQDRVEALEARSNSSVISLGGLSSSRMMMRAVRNLRRQVTRLRRAVSLDECSSGPCQHGGTCIDGYLTYTCLCRQGWIGDDCNEDNNECYEFFGTDLNGATCVNTDGGYRCECQPGFYGVHCHQTANNCSSASRAALCGGHGVCIPAQNGHLSYICICNEGWKANPSGSTCIDVDECTSYHPHCSKDPPVQCVNYPGGFACGPCPQGYSGDGHVCRDVDECLLNNGGCSPYSECFNTPGGRRCGSCAAGYSGDGVTCLPAPRACQYAQCHPLATCVDNPSMSPTYYQCICPSGYEGTGIGLHGCLLTSGGGGGGGGGGGRGGGGQLQPTNWCATQPCVNGGSCIQSASNYSCICVPWYSGRNCELNLDECASNPCMNGGTCSQGINTFTCNCPSSHTGDRCQTENEQCGGVLRGTEGVVTYPGVEGQLYNHNISCAWIIRVPRGKVINVTFQHFHMEGGRCNFDWLQIHDGLQMSSQLIGRFCGTSLPGNNGSIISTHNFLYLWFHSDHSVAGFGFNFTWNTTDPVCGEDFHGQEYGSFNSPGYPGRYPINRDCYWTVTVQPGKRIKFHFATLQIEVHPNCSFDFLEIRDGLTETGQSLGKFCTTQAPPPVTTSGSEAFLHFHSDVSISDTGFHISYSAEPGTPGCGGLLTNDVGEFSAPTLSDTYEHNQHCEWLIRVPAGETIQLNISELHVEHHPGCFFDYLAIRDGGSADSPLISKSCGTTLPEPVRSTGNQLFVVFHSDHSITFRGFRARYQVACGGELTGNTGIFKSPYHPQPYPHDRTCVYIIRQTPGKAIRLNFTEFDIEGPSMWSGCVFDYVEVRDGRRDTAPLLGKFCGPSTHRPEPIISTHNYLRVKFRTDSSISNRGFLANYTTIDTRCGGVLRDIFGLVNSPNSPDTYPSNTDCNWVLDLPPGYVIQITWQSFSLEQHFNCRYDYIEIFDNSSIPGSGGRMGEHRYCGSDTPPIMTSSDNLVTIHFHSDHSVNHDGFSFTYHGIDASRSCGGHYHTEMGMISSPNYPEYYPHQRTCEWTISVAVRHQIRLTFVDVEIEEADNCGFDSLEIRNGKYDTSPLMTKICSRNKTVPEVFSHNHQLYLKFRSDPSVSYEGFKLFWDAAATGCGGHMTAETGEIISPGYPQPYHHLADCYWTITVAEGSAVRLHFIDMDMETSPGCYYDFIEVRDGSSPLSHLLGRYCSLNLGVISLNSSGNSLWLRFRSDYSSSGRGFKATYMTDCNRVVRGPRGVITTPGFPDPYPLNRNCTWTIVAPLGNSINASFSSFVLEDHINQETNECLFDYVELYESQDRDRRGSRLGHYCRNLPPPVATASRMNRLEVNFVSDYLVPMNGFRMEWIVNGCGGELTKSSGIILSPNYPNSYPSNTECEWHISTHPGTKIQITIHSIDLENAGNCIFDVLQIHGGEDNTSPRLTSLCHEQMDATTVTTQGNQAFISFRSDQSVRGKGFNISYTSLPGGCGGLFTTPSGTIHSPNYPQHYDVHSDCVWTIRVNRLHVVELNFTNFDVEPSTNCTYDYVSVWDGENEDFPLLLQHCGASLPVPSLVRASGNVMTVRLKADGSLSAKGFTANYQMGCGASLEVSLDETGELTSPHYPSPYTATLNCSWHIYAPPGYRVHLHIVHLDIHSRFPPNVNCSHEYLAVLDGGQLDSPMRGKYCGDRAPRSIVSSSEYLTVTLINNYAFVTFKAAYSVFSSRCGGTMTSARGELASPHYPEPYPGHTECEWTVNAGPGNSLRLDFIEFDLEETDGCNLNYVEVHERDPTGPLLLHNCTTSSTSLPAPITVREYLWIKFRSDINGVGARGFLASYSLLFGNSLYGESGEVTSPLYPHTYMGAEDITWTITVPWGKYVSITFLDMDIESNPVVDECNAGLVIYNGPSSEYSSVLGTFCGYETPSEPILTGRRSVLVRLNFRHVHEGSRFKFRYDAVSRSENMGQSHLAGASNNCSYMVSINGSSEISNPGHPGYANNLNCEWIIEAPPHEKIKIFIMFELEESSSCFYDYIGVYDGVGGKRNWNLTEKLCRREQNHYFFISSGRYLRLRFITDGSVNHNGFRAFLYTVCGGFLEGAEGVISSPKFPDNYPSGQDCQWSIRVGIGKTIRLEFDTFRVANSTSTCGGDYLLIRNGGTQSSPFLGAGKFCGLSTPQIGESSSNILLLRFVTDNSIHEKGFKLRYYEQAATCGGQHRLTADLPRLTIHSPNFPNSPNPYTECSWTILAPSEKTISLHFDDTFTIPNLFGSCDQAFIEVRDGGTIISPPLLDKFCGTINPGTVHTTGSAIYVRYYNNITEHHPGFQADATIDTCGGSYNAIDGGYLSTPGFPGPYAHDLNCTWRIVAPLGHYVSLHMLDVDIYSLSDNCTQPRARLQIRDENATGEILGTYCSSGELVEPVNTASNIAFISFRGGDNPANSKGVRIMFNSSQEECGGEVTGIEGEIRSPGYPHGYPSRRICDWVIRVPAGKRVQLRFLDLDIPSAQMNYAFTDDVYHYCPDFIAIRNGPEVHSPVLTGRYICSNILPGGVDTLNSSMNVMRVTFKTQGHTQARGFRAQWTSDDPQECGGELPSISGQLASPGLHSSSYNHSLYCVWTLTNPHPENSSFVVTFTFLHLESHCFDYVLIQGENIEGEVEKIQRVCNEHNLAPIIVPYQTLKISFITDSSINATGWNLTYGLGQCGGTLHGPQNVLTSPRYPAHYSNNVHCAWLLNYGDGEQIDLEFTNFRLEDSYHHDYVAIHNGPRFTSPLLGHYTGTTRPEHLRSMTNNLLIEFHTDDSDNDQGFRAVASRHTRGCGGVFHGMTGNLSSQQFPQDYPANTECEWEIDLPAGYHVVVAFVDRFDVETSSNCENDYVQVFQSNNSGPHTPTMWFGQNKLCGKQAPLPVTSTGSRIKLLFHSNDAVQGKGFKVSWVTHCGRNYTNPTGYIVSPGHPDVYPPNTNCEFRILASPQQFVTIHFFSFVMEPGTNCMFDSLEVVSYGSLSYFRPRRLTTTMGPYCGRNEPPNVLTTRGTTVLRFRSDYSVQMTGFVANYSVSGCGGNMTAPGIIELPTRPTYHNHMACTWYITAPSGKVPHFKFQMLDVEPSRRCHYDKLSIYNGHTTQEEKLLRRFCGDHTESLPTVVTQEQEATVQFTTDHSVTGQGLKIALEFSYACGSNVNISYEGASQTIRSLDFNSDGNYEPMLDCQWLVRGQPNHVVTLNFTRLDLEPPGANDTIPCPYDSVEVRDGPSIASPLIGVFCNASTSPPTVSSSSDVMFVRLLTDSVNQRVGFTATLTNTPHPCGVSGLQATNESQVIQTPGYPYQYPVSTRCKWVITAPEDQDIEIEVEDLRLESSLKCVKDRLYVSDYDPNESSSFQIMPGNSRYTHNIGGRRVYWLSNKLAHAYCGTTIPHNIFSTTNAMELRFVSDGETVAQGFRIRYSLGTCNRTYNGSSGNVFSRRRSSCFSTFVAPAGSFINLYFSGFATSTSHGQGCSDDRSLKVFDGADSSATLLLHACGYSLPAPVFSTSNSLHLEFRPSSWDYFRLNYATSTQSGGCGGALFFRRWGYVTSPGYPGPASPGLDCMFSLSTTPDVHILLRFRSTDFGGSDGCNNTFLEVYDVTATGDTPLVITLCGQENVALHFAPSNKMALRYVTGNGNITGQGWLARIDVGDPHESEVFDIDSSTQEEESTESSL
ncbi:cubilin-like [Homarus americanus]|uniref:cubilin-like n=1 Tax=Homarus americanus TaxID=6706 RepID=UPI001C473DC0|nr:cubilin-like [Homarus americanus]